MAHIEIISDTAGVLTPKMVVADENEGREDIEPNWVGTCTCGVTGSDRGNFEDTVQWGLIHIEGAHE